MNTAFALNHEDSSIDGFASGALKKVHKMDETRNMRPFIEVGT